MENTKRGRPIKKNKKKQYTITMDTNLHEELQEIAEQNGLSFSSFISYIANQYLKEEKLHE